MLLMENTN